MPFRIYNTASRKVQVFKPLKAGRVRIYACGPTVYNYPHIGNLRSFLFADLLRRWLEYRGFRVTQVMNITDVDDKTIRGSQSEQMPLQQFTRKYEIAFFADTDALRIKRADIYCRATEHMAEILSLIKRLLGAGLAYVAEDGVYYDISKFREYGLLARIQPKPEEIERGGAGASFSRVAADEYAKEELRDFALWKFWRQEDGDVAWDSPWGRGRPGWHIECSAMSMKYLGDSFDIHTGGVDLIFPHHENEIAQSAGVTDKMLARYWVHCEHLIVEGRKMSKSLHNIITLQDIAKTTKLPALRYLLLSAHYRHQMNFTEKSLRNAEETLAKLNDFYSRLQWLAGQKLKAAGGMVRKIKNARKRFEKFLDNDLDTPHALVAVHKITGDFNKAADKGRAGKKDVKAMLIFLAKFNSVFDILETGKERLKEEERELIEERERLRKMHKYKEADMIREALRRRGVAIEDTPHGPRWKRASN